MSRWGKKKTTIKQKKEAWDEGNADAAQPLTSCRVVTHFFHENNFMKYVGNEGKLCIPPHLFDRWLKVCHRFLQSCRLPLSSLGSKRCRFHICGIRRGATFAFMYGLNCKLYIYIGGVESMRCIGSPLSSRKAAAFTTHFWSSSRAQEISNPLSS